jgi:uncharacterized protein (TIGR02996 family)
MREDDFLRAVCADPKDDALLKVYSDWLEEQGDAASAGKAEFLRLTAAPAEPGRDARLHKLAASLDTDWLAVVSRMRIENCAKKRAEGETRRPGPVRFEFVCDRRWEDLRPTDERAVRFCDACELHVHYCDTITDARKHALRGHCVAVDLGVMRREWDLRERRILMGRMSPEAAQREAELAKPDPVSAMRERRKQKEAGEEG